jgi:hypothetical protein
VRTHFVILYKSKYKCRYKLQNYFATLTLTQE